MERDINLSIFFNSIEAVFLSLSNRCLNEMKVNGFCRMWPLLLGAATGRGVGELAVDKMSLTK